DRYEASPHGRSVREELVAIVEADVSVFREEEDFIKVLVREALSFRGETYGVIVQGLAPFLDAVQQILAGGQRTGAVRTDRPLWQLALLFVGNLSLLYTQYWGSAGAWPTLEELPELAASAFLDGASRPNTPD
ncbi:MAG: hypothetical protein KC609_03330, partial [Myxococcales bacterium]|nr:hypothetical protein [Myxococcales bacterium]